MGSECLAEREKESETRVTVSVSSLSVNVHLNARVMQSQLSRSLSFLPFFLKLLTDCKCHDQLTLLQVV